MIQYDGHIWTDHLFALRGSVVLQIAFRVLVTGATAAAVVALHQHWPWLAIPATAHGFVGAALGWLLVMRTNASYDRFWEGRKQWGAIVNDVRNLVRAGSVLFAADPELARTFARWAVALPPAIMNNLRGHRGIGPAAGLPTAEVEAVLASAHPPLHICRRLTQLAVEARGRGVISDIQQTSLDATIGLLVGYFGACERIQKTPLPFAYVVHLRRALILYCFSVPFVVVKDFGWATVLVTLIVSYIFFGIEEIGVEIENPFGMDENDLPLEDICAGIARSSLSLVPGAQSDPAAPPPRT